MKTRIKILTPCILVISLLQVGCQRSDSLPASGEYQPGMRYFDRAMIKLMEDWDIPGGSLAVLQDGEVVLARGYGYANVENGELAQPGSLFRIASVSKPITAVAVLKLVEEGKLDLDMPAFQIIDDLQPPDGTQVDPRIANITIRHLLEHAGGWDRNISFDPMFMAREIAEELGVPVPADNSTIIRYMLAQPLDFNPGTSYAYSNFGYCVLGRIIEKVTGLTYETYVKTQILAPAGIDQMRIGHSSSVVTLKGEAHYYDEENLLVESVFPEHVEAVPQPYGGFYLEAMDSHGGWIASAEDLVRFAYALESSHPDALLASETLALMLTRPDISIWEGTSNYYALGFFTRPSGKNVVWWHAGSLPGTTALLYRTSSGLIWAALFNTWPDPSSDEFIVDVITSMGQAAIMDEILWISAIVIIVVIGLVLFLIVSKRKKRSDRKLNKKRRLTWNNVHMTI